MKLDLPVNQQNSPPPPINPVKNVLSINAQDQVLWNGTPVTLQQLRTYLDATQQMNPIPELHLQPDATARYEMVDEVLAVTKQRAHPEDGLRRQRILHARLLGFATWLNFEGGLHGPPFSVFP